MNSHMPVVSFGCQSNTGAQPIATKKQAEMYCCKYVSKHHKNRGAAPAIFDIMDKMEAQDQHGQEMRGQFWQSTTLAQSLSKAFMAEIGEEMCQAEVAHHANHLPEYLVPRKVRNVHLYREMLAISVPTAAAAEEAPEENYWVRIGFGRSAFTANPTSSCTRAARATGSGARPRKSTIGPALGGTCPRRGLCASSSSK